MLLGKNIATQRPNIPTANSRRASSDGLERAAQLFIQKPDVEVSDRGTSRIQSAKKRHRNSQNLALLGVEGPKHASLDCGADPHCTVCTCSHIDRGGLKNMYGLIETRPAGLWDTAPLGASDQDLADDIATSNRKGDLARCINHCCEPNCVMQKWNVGGVQHVGLFAKYPIPAGVYGKIHYQRELKCGSEVASLPRRRCFAGSELTFGYDMEFTAVET